MSVLILDNIKDNYCVMGNPVAHSRSPQIHEAFANQTGQAIYYQKIKVPLGQFKTYMQQFQSLGGKGMNVTLPFKGDAWQACMKNSPAAEVAHAVNTISIVDGVTHGENTDGIGLVRDLMANYDVELKEKNILIMGAGGAAQGIIVPLLEQNPAEIVIVNRTLSKAVTLADTFNTGYNVSACTYEALGLRKFDLVINATSASLSDKLPPVSSGILGNYTVCYDMVYAARDTVFVDWAKKQGAILSVDGLGMLVEQAAESFYIWRGVRPETTSVIEALRTGKL